MAYGINIEVGKGIHFKNPELAGAGGYRGGTRPLDISHYLRRKPYDKPFEIDDPFKNNYKIRKSYGYNPVFDLSTSPYNNRNLGISDFSAFARPIIDYNMLRQMEYHSLSNKRNGAGYKGLEYQKPTNPAEYNGKIPNNLGKSRYCLN
jgi:hypothetical protein